MANIAGRGEPEGATRPFQSRIDIDVRSFQLGPLRISPDGTECSLRLVVGEFGRRGSNP